VLPLTDSGAFHGACWRVDGRNIIVLKQKEKSLAKWLFDLLHELRHAGENPESPSLTVIEEEETSDSQLESEEEQIASQFAGDVILDERADELAHKCRAAAEGDISRLKTAVPRVAERENVPADALANYMAFRLALEGENWWGAARNLQPKGISPFQIARDQLLQNLKLEDLARPDITLLHQAIVSQEE
jgi:hypothetical protein